MLLYFVCFHSLGDFYFITIISSSALLSEALECNLSSSSDSHTPQRRSLRFWLSEPTASVPNDAKHCTIFHASSCPILLCQSVSSSEQPRLLPAKTIIYIAALQRKHNHCFLWKTKGQRIIGAICFPAVWMGATGKMRVVCEKEKFSECSRMRWTDVVLSTVTFRSPFECKNSWTSIMFI